MPLVVPHVAKRPMMLLWLQGFEAVGVSTLHLYSNNVTPSAATVLEDLLECEFAGYAPRLFGLGEVIDGLDGGSRSLVTWPGLSWVKEEGTNGDVFGLYVLSAEDELLWVERAPTAPIVMDLVDRELMVIPKLTGRSEFMNS